MLVVGVFSAHRLKREEVVVVEKISFLRRCCSNKGVFWEGSALWTKRFTEKEIDEKSMR